MTIIAIEGIDGVGKTSLSVALSKEINGLIKSTSIIEGFLPGVKQLVNACPSEYLLPRFIYYLSTTQLRLNEVKINSGEYVIFDRYFFSTYVVHKAIDELYNKSNDSLKIDKLMSAAMSSFLNPNFVIFLHTEEKERISRLLRRDQSCNTHLDFDSKLTAKVDTDFKKLRREMENNRKIKTIDIDNTKISIAQTVSIVTRNIRAYQNA